ncbi:hypothetical protein [Bacillus gaemokensis]|nr:hypothetical protein [Bacillus gaemokensis]
MDIMEPCFYCVSSYSDIDLDLRPFIKDKDDFHLYQAAIFKNVNYIVTNNDDGLKGVKSQLEAKDIRIVSFKEFEDIMNMRAQEI